MNLEELKRKLQVNDIPERWYSINDGLKSDAHILYKNYSNWECFYLDEKGDRLDMKIFKNEEDAFDYLWEKLRHQQSIFNRFK